MESVLERLFSGAKPPRRLKPIPSHTLDAPSSIGSGSIVPGVLEDLLQYAVFQHTDKIRILLSESHHYTDEQIDDIDLYAGKTVKGSVVWDYKLLKKKLEEIERRKEEESLAQGNLVTDKIEKEGYRDDIQGTNRISQDFDESTVTEGEASDDEFIKALAVFSAIVSDGVTINDLIDYWRNNHQHHNEIATKVDSDIDTLTRHIETIASRTLLYPALCSEFDSAGGPSVGQIECCLAILPAAEEMVRERIELLDHRHGEIYQIHSNMDVHELLDYADYEYGKESVSDVMLMKMMHLTTFTPAKVKPEAKDALLLHLKDHPEIWLWCVGDIVKREPTRQLTSNYTSRETAWEIIEKYKDYCAFNTQPRMGVQLSEMIIYMQNNLKTITDTFLQRNPEYQDTPWIVCKDVLELQGVENTTATLGDIRKEVMKADIRDIRECIAIALYGQIEKERDLTLLQLIQRLRLKTKGESKSNPFIDTFETRPDLYGITIGRIIDIDSWPAYLKANGKLGFEDETDTKATKPTISEEARNVLKHAINSTSEKLPGMGRITTDSKVEAVIAWLYLIGGMETQGDISQLQPYRDRKISELIQ